MKTHPLLILTMCSVLLCCKTEVKDDLPKTNGYKYIILKPSSIDAFKNGKPFVNYLGEKLDNC